MRKYDAIVIGAGNTGLATACTLAKKGVKTLILEQHNVPGGYASTFRRGRFEFEGSLHHLSGYGTKENPGPLCKLFDELDINDKVELINLPNIYRFVVPGMYDFVLPCDKDQMTKVLQDNFPEERDSIERFFKVLYSCWEEFVQMYDFQFDFMNMDKKLDPEASPEKYPNLFKYAFRSLPSVLAEFFKNPILRAAVAMLSMYSGPVPDIDFIDLATWVYEYLIYGSYHVKGGSQALSNAIVDSYTSYGGEIEYNSDVQKILVENGHVTGVVTDSGETILANRVISNVSPLVVYGEMVEPEYVPKRIFDSYRGLKLGGATSVVYLGLDIGHEELGFNDTNVFIMHPQKGMLAITSQNAACEEAFPAGTTQLELAGYQTASKWMCIPPHQYAAEKYKMAEDQIELAEAVFPNIREHIEEMEISTPLTNMRYVRAPGGAIGGLKYYFRRYVMFPTNQQDLIEGLNFACAGTTQPGGYRPALSFGHAMGEVLAETLLGN